MQEIFAELNRYNQSAATNGRPIFRCVNFYRWCGYCDGWNIDGADKSYKAQVLADLDASVAKRLQIATVGLADRFRDGDANGTEARSEVLILTSETKKLDMFIWVHLCLDSPYAR